MTDADEVPPGAATGSGAPGEEQQVSPWFLANALLRRRRLILTMALVSGVAVGLVSYLSTRMYVASASFIPQEARTSQSLLSQLAPQFGLVLGRASASSPEFYASLLQSKEVLRDVVVTRFHLPTSPRSEGDLVRYFRIGVPSRGRAISLAVRRLQGIVSVGTDRNTGVVSFDVTTESPELAEQIATRFLDLVNDYNLRRQQSQAKAEREFLEQRLEAAQRQLDAAEGAYATFLARNRRFESYSELRAEAGRLERQINVRQQLYLSLSQYYELAKLEEVRNTPVITVIQHPEGFVDRKARGTIVKAVLGLVLGALVGAFLAFGSERVRRLHGHASEDYAEFRAGVDELLSGVRRRLRRGAA